MDLQNRMELGRAERAAGLGVMATAAMTVLMVVGIFPGAPLALRPFPVELAHHVFPSLGAVALTAVTLLVHFAYGAAAAVAFSFLARPMSPGRGFLFGFVLWLIMQGGFVPWGYGWLEFGIGQGHPWAAVYTLGLHLCYGGTLGWLGARDEAGHHATFDATDRLRVA